MDALLLRDEFLRLSDLYPELWHALAIGGKDLHVSKDYDRIVGELERSLRESFGLEVMQHEMMSNDVRAISFYAWCGALDATRANGAVQQFRSLARTAVDSVAIKPFPGRVEPLFSVGCGMIVGPSSGEYIIEEPPEPDDRDHEWVGHLFSGANLSPQRLWIGNTTNSAPQCLDLLVLPNSFRASAHALAGAEQFKAKGDQRIRPTLKTLQIIHMIEKGKSTNEINEATGGSVDNIRKIRSQYQRGKYRL